MATASSKIWLTAVVSVFVLLVLSLTANQWPQAEEKNKAAPPAPAVIAAEDLKKELDERALIMEKAILTLETTVSTLKTNLQKEKNQDLRGVYQLSVNDFELILASIKKTLTDVNALRIILAAVVDKKDKTGAACELTDKNKRKIRDLLSRVKEQAEFSKRVVDRLVDYLRGVKIVKGYIFTVSVWDWMEEGNKTNLLDAQKFADDAVTKLRLLERMEIAAPIPLPPPAVEPPPEPSPPASAPAPAPEPSPSPSPSPSSPFPPPFVPDFRSSPDDSAPPAPPESLFVPAVPEPPLVSVLEVMKLELADLRYLHSEVLAISVFRNHMVLKDRLEQLAARIKFLEEQIKEYNK